MDSYYLNAVSYQQSNVLQNIKITEQHSCFYYSTQYSELHQRSHQMQRTASNDKWSGLHDQGVINCHQI